MLSALAALATESKTDAAAVAADDDADADGGRGDELASCSVVTALERCRLAMRRAAERYEISALIEAEDMVYAPNERVMMTYIALFRDYSCKRKAREMHAMMTERLVVEEAEAKRAHEAKAQEEVEAERAREEAKRVEAEAEAEAKS